jgi:hypothetical protein
LLLILETAELLMNKATTVSESTHSSPLRLPTVALLVLAGGYFLLAQFLGKTLQFEFLQSDVLGYWQDSLAWRTPYHPFHVPAYPLMIAMLRGVTFGVPSAVSIMMTINLVAFLASAFLVYRILMVSGVDEKLAALGMLLFGLWPFVGLTYTVNPLADLPSMFFFLAGLYLLLTSRKLTAALLLGLAMVTHKAMWIFVGLLLVAELLHSQEYFSTRNLLFIFMTFLPLGVLWLLGFTYHSSPAWLFSSNLDVEVASRGSLPLLDGLWGTFIEGGAKGLVKGFLMAGFACLSVFTIVAGIRLKVQGLAYSLAISLAVLILFLLLNRYEIWAAMRYGRLLAIPLMLIANTSVSLRTKNWWSSPVMIAGLSVLLLSQFAYAWYAAIVYFG